MDVLKGILEECGLVCPYDDVLVERLESACEHFVEADEFDDAEYSACVECYIKDRCFLSLKDFIENYAQENDWDEMDFPECVWKALTFFVIYIAIKNNVDEAQKAIYSSTLQNFLLLCKGNWETLKYQDYLVKLYGDISNYLDANEQGGSEVDMKFVSNIFDGTTTIEVKGDLRMMLEAMGKYTWLYKLEHFWDDSEFVSERNAFLKVLYFLNYWMRETPSIYVHIGLKDMLRLAGVSKSTAKKSLRQIIADYKAIGKELLDTPVSKSSVIFRLLNDSYGEEAAFLDEKLTPSEFFVYLYYETLLELKLRENGRE